MKVYLLMTKSESKQEKIHGIFFTKNGAIDAAKKHKLYSNLVEVEIFEIDMEVMIKDISKLKIA